MNITQRRRHWAPIMPIDNTSRVGGNQMMIKTSNWRNQSNKTIHMQKQDSGRPTRSQRAPPPPPPLSGATQLVTRAGLRNSRILFALADDSESMIEVRRFLVPAQVRPGELRRLACQYELHGASLHAMKLFKDEKEFYRYTPSNPPGDQRLSFPGAGVHVDMSRSGEREVWLKINKRSTGQYKCQVTIEGKFISVSAEKRMSVITGTGSPSAITDGPSAAAPAAPAAPGSGTQTGPGGTMWRHHPATGVASSGANSRLPLANYLNQDQLGLGHLPVQVSNGLNAVMQSSVGVSLASHYHSVLWACLLLATLAALLSPTHCYCAQLATRHREFALIERVLRK